MPVQKHATGPGAGETCDYMEQRGLAATGRPQQAGNLAGFHMQVDGVQNLDVTKALGNVLDIQTRHALLPRPFSSKIIGAV